VGLWVFGAGLLADPWCLVVSWVQLCTHRHPTPNTHRPPLSSPNPTHPRTHASTQTPPKTTGPVDAAYKAIDSLVRVDTELLDYTVSSVTEGINALATTRWAARTGGALGAHWAGGLGFRG